MELIRRVERRSPTIPENKSISRMTIRMGTLYDIAFIAINSSLMIIWNNLAGKVRKL